MLPQRLLIYRTRDPNRVHPDFLGLEDVPWLEHTVLEFRKFEGRRLRELGEHFSGALPFDAPRRKLLLALHVLRKMWGKRVDASISPPKVRAALFGRAARHGGGREEVLAGCAHALGVDPVQIEKSLFADLARERVLGACTEDVGPGELRLRANQALAQGLLARSRRLSIAVLGQTRRVVRQAKLGGLLCVVRNSANTAARSALGPAATQQGVTLDVSGPLALFRHTTMYGRSLASLLPVLKWTNHFRLRADVVLDSQPLVMELSTGAPVFPAKVSGRWDSGVEEKLEKDFGRLAPQWHVVREAEPIPVGHELVFPDFVLVHRDRPARRWVVEVVGYWTPEYLERKLRLLRAAGISNLILCIDERRGCGKDELPSGARVIRYKTRVDARAVLNLLDEAAA